MLEVLNWQALLMIALLIGVVWYKQRLIHRDAYRDGATQGFLLGIDRTIKVLTDKNMITDGDNAVNKSELVKRLAPVITANVVDELDKLVQKAKKP